MPRLSGAIIAGLVALLAPGPAHSEWNPITFHLQGSGWGEWNRENTIRQAMWLINDRFLDAATVEKAYQDNGLPLVTSDLWATTNLNSCSPWLGYQNLLQYQLFALRHTRIKPELYIWAEYQPTKPATAWADPYQVRIRYDGPGPVTITGNFRVTVNTFFLGSSWQPLSKPHYWAGVLAHEMLHNLGHMHEDNMDHPNYERRQIRAFQRACGRE